MTNDAKNDATAGYSAAADGASKLKGFLWIAVCLVLAVILAVGIAPLARAVPWRWEQKLAVAVGPPDLGAGTCHAAPGAKDALQKLVARLYPAESGDDAFTVDVHVVKLSMINAFAGLGGHIVVTTGLLAHAESAEEAAGVLAHEMEHVRRRHIMQGAMIHMLTAAGLQAVFSGDPSGAENWAGYFINMSFTRQQEEEADEGGLKRLQAAHIDNSGFKHFFERMEKSGFGEKFLSDHPSSESRAELVDDFKNENTRPVMSAEEWAALKHYCK
jgi:Zn-dependent protease with chaperone function